MSFLPYCTVCDMQLSGSGKNMLYCSEKCRKKDARALNHESFYSESTHMPAASDHTSSDQSLCEDDRYSLLSAPRSIPTKKTKQATPLLSQSPSSINCNSSTDFAALSYSSSSSMLLSSSRRHPISLYSSSPRSVDLVSPFKSSSVKLSALASSHVSRHEPITAYSYDMPLVLDKRDLLCDSSQSSVTEGSLKKLFNFNEMQKS
ncbi:hypothetical protein V1514DRAFT_335998 [Lipomyces japonicus]|uniref:uncharacterized protein n=1 Tax=Lipomyces japonicus TaxID=56871 RepID=UPI0034CDDCCB